MSPIAEVVTMPARAVGSVPDIAFVSKEAEQSFTASMAKDAASDQPEFDGMPIREERYAFKSVSALFIPGAPLPAYNENRSFKVKGRCKGFALIEGIKTALIEVLDAELGA